MKFREEESDIDGIIGFLLLDNISHAKANL
jgi:hypothetical protein